MFCFHRVCSGYAPPSASTHSTSATLAWPHHTATQDGEAPPPGCCGLAHALPGGRSSDSRVTLAQVTAAHAQRRMVNSAKSNDNKVTKRGTLEDPSVARRKDKLPMGPLMIGFFLFVVVGSCTSLQPRPQTCFQLLAPSSAALTERLSVASRRSRAADHQPGWQGLGRIIANRRVHTWAPWLSVSSSSVSSAAALCR